MSSPVSRSRRRPWRTRWCGGSSPPDPRHLPGAGEDGEPGLAGGGVVRRDGPGGRDPQDARDPIAEPEPVAASGDQHVSHAELGEEPVAESQPVGAVSRVGVGSHPDGALVTARSDAFVPTQLPLPAVGQWWSARHTAAISSRARTVVRPTTPGMRNVLGTKGRSAEGHVVAPRSSARPASTGLGQPSEPRSAATSTTATSPAVQTMPVVVVLRAANSAAEP